MSHRNSLWTSCIHADGPHLGAAAPAGYGKKTFFPGWHSNLQTLPPKKTIACCGKRLPVSSVLHSLGRGWSPQLGVALCFPPFLPKLHLLAIWAPHTNFQGPSTSSLSITPSAWVGAGGRGVPCSSPSPHPPPHNAFSLHGRGHRDLYSNGANC